MRWTHLLLLLAVATRAGADTMPPSLTQLSCSACPSPNEVRKRFSANQWQTLGEGSPVTQESTADGQESAKQRDIEASAIVPWPPQLVWDVLVDFDSRPKFMPSSTKSKITKVSGSDVWVDQELSVLWEDIHFSVINTIDAEHGTIHWVMNKDAPHDIADTTGSWQVAPLDGGKHTFLIYRSHTDTGRAVPAAIETFLIKRSIPKMIEAVRNETKRRGKGTAFLLPADEK